MSKFWKQKRNRVIVIIAIFLLIIFGIVAFLYFNKETRNNVTKEYSIYMENNGLIKIVYQESYDECTKNNETYRCSDITISDIQITLLNDEAKTLYSNINIEGKSLEEILDDFLGSNDTWQIITNNESLKEKIDSEYSNVSVKIKNEMNEEEIVKELSEITYYTITFDTDGAPPIDSIVVEEGKLLSMPETITKEGYIFVEWQVDGTAYNFENPVTKDMTVKAIWKKEETTSNPSSGSNNQVSNGKINLNNNISITEYHISSGNADCFYYMFVTNLQEVFKTADITKTANGPSEVDFWYTKDRQETEVSTEEIIEYVNSGTLKIDSSNENNFKNTLDKYKNGKYSGISNVSYTVEDHRFTFSYDYISFNGLNVSSYGEQANKEIQNILVNATKFKGPCGGFDTYQNKILNEELCSQYNLDCGRW